MTKLSLSHALAQSVKISLFEELIDATIEQTKNIPSDIAESGKIAIKRKDIMRQIGQLFILRINVNLIGSVLDSPEIFWVQPQLEPLCRFVIVKEATTDLLSHRPGRPFVSRDWTTG